MSSMLDVGDVQPPAYDDTVNESRAQLSCGETPTFYLDRTTIFANTDPPRELYELSNDVCEAKSVVYGVQKVAYRVTQAAGGDKVRTRLDHIYDFSLDPLAGLESSKLADAVVIEGKMNSKRTHKEIHLVPGVSSWKVKDHFKAGESVMHKLKHADEIQWKNTKGEVIAVETVAKRDAEKKLSCFPQLEIKMAMDDKEMDLLVTSWVARVWRQSASELKEPMNWQDFKTMSKNAFGTKGNRFSVWDLNPGKIF
ncbi:hypothetical protein CGCF415_v012162 [Colletotrichum fructicola]|nr:hypothetical protein CGCF415_v012162 [Colletotrichum fructicola]KAF5504560.1 hypothetical protein CGCF413_v004400 [Colletotrichum fructicola]